MIISRRAFIASLAAVPAVAGLAAGARLLTDDESSMPRVVAAGPAPTGAWTYRGDAARTGQMPGPGWDAPPATVWAADLGASSVAPPAAVDGVVYAGCGGVGHGAIVALDARTGTERWRFATGGDVQSAPAVAGDIVVAGSLDKHYYGLDAHTGVERWRFAAEALVGGAPVISGGLVYVTCNDAKVYALDIASGEVVWKFDRKIGTSVAPAIAGETLIVGGGELESNEPALFALDAATGKKRWTKEFGSWVIAAPTVVDGIVYVATSVYLGMNGPAVLVGLDPESGDLRSYLELEDSIGAPVLVQGRTAYVTTELNALQAIDLDTLAQQWTYRDMADGDFWPDPFSPVMTDGLLYVPTIRATVGVWSQGLAALDPATGAPRWTWAGPDPDAKYTTPAIIDGVAYTASSDGHLYAVAASSGAVATPIAGIQTGIAIETRPQHRTDVPA